MAVVELLLERQADVSLYDEVHVTQGNVLCVFVLQIMIMYTVLSGWLSTSAHVMLCKVSNSDQLVAV